MLRAIACLFNPCAWRWHGNTLNVDGTARGLYQCHRCKTLSCGAPRT